MNDKLFPMKLPDKTPLLAEVRQISVDKQQPVPMVQLSIVLEEVSAEALVAARVFEALELPERSPAEPIELRLDLVAKESVCQDFAKVLRQSPDPATLIVEGPKLNGEAVSPFHVISNYELVGWETQRRQGVPGKVLTLDKEPPVPVIYRGAGLVPSIFAVVSAFLQEDDWPVSRFEAGGIVQTWFQGENGHWGCYGRVREEEAQFVFYSVCPVNAPEERRPAVVEFLTRANYGLIIGNFEMDFRDGEIRYKTSIDVEGDCLSRALVKQLVYANVLTMDRYLPGIMGVLYGNESPAEAIARIEGPAPL